MLLYLLDKSWSLLFIHFRDINIYLGNDKQNKKYLNFSNEFAMNLLCFQFLFQKKFVFFN